MKKIDWEKYRQLYPHLKDQLYLNHAAIAPMNRRAFTALQDFCTKRLSEKVEFWPDASEKKAAFIKTLAELIQAPAENIALTSNTSSGLNTLALGLTWRPGDRILLNDFEFPSNVIPFINLRRLGVEIDYVKHRNGIIDIGDIRRAVRPQTRLLSISFVEFMNGYRNDLKALASICREHEMIFSVDAIQGLGALKMDVRNMDIDFLSCGGHKWLMWPAGLGMIYVSPRIFDQLYPAQAGWMSLEVPFDFFNYHQPFAATAQRFEAGTFNTMGIVMAMETVTIMLEIGVETIEEKIMSNTDFLIRRLQESGFELYTPTEPAHRSGIVTFFHPRAEDLFNYLRENKIFVSLREGKIRIAPHFYNNHDDLERFISCVNTFSAD
jgi:cysteine desulfurase/selenocysteine lyase